MNFLFKSKKFIFTGILFSFGFFSSQTFAMGRFDESSGNYKEEHVKKIEKNSVPQKPEDLDCFINGYPDVKFSSAWIEDKNDWLITVGVQKNDGSFSETKLYWCESRFLPEEKLSEKDNYRQMLYVLPESVPDPQKFTDEEIQRIKEWTSKENRKNGAIDPPFLFNAIYNVGGQVLTESHIKKVNIFDGWSVNVHEKLKGPLEKITKKINALPKDDEMSKFLKSLSRTDGFNWRTVRDTQSRSFHSIGLAIDILPKGYYQKIIYWGWQKQQHPDSWWNTPIESRWTPPKRVIDIFREEGFIWGGVWIVWDNMHFEYHPELLIYNAKHK